MDGSAVMSPLAVDETGLARAAAAGDGGAFGTLYRRYEEQLFNVAYRISGSEEIAGEAVQRAFRSMMGGGSRPDEEEVAFGAYLLTETRNAAHDLMDGREGAESGAAVTNGNGVLPDEQEEIGSANMRLPERQREALALRELGGLSYGEIAAIMETQRDSVAQLISRGRINIGDELHGTVLASVAAPSPECERALPLIAMRDDDQLDAGSADAAWLDAHLADCERCRLGVEAMQEAAVSYQAWAPLAVAPSLLKATMAMAAELAGADWSKEIAEAAARKRARPRNSPGSSQIAGHRVQRPTGGGILAAAAAALLLLVALAAIVLGDENFVFNDKGTTEKSAELDTAAPRQQEANPFERGDALGQTATVEKGETRTTADPGGTTTSPT